MKGIRIPFARLGLVLAACASFVSGAEVCAQVPDSIFPDLGDPFAEEKEKIERKSYESKVALRWELSRRFSEHVIEEYLPKFLEMAKKSNPENGDRQAWARLGGTMGEAWLESRKHEKTGTAPSDQREWEDEHNGFLAGIKVDGAVLVDWRHMTSVRTSDLQKAADEAPSRFAEIGKSMSVIDPVWAKAIELAASAASKSWSREDLKAAQAAFADLKGKRDLALSTYGAIAQARDYAVAEHGKKPSLDEDKDEKDLLIRWSRNERPTFKHVEKTYRDQRAEMAKLIGAWHDKEVAAWEAMQKAFEPVKSGSIRASSPYRDCPWDRKVAECIQKTLDDLATAIAGAGRKVEGAEAKVLEDKAATEKEYRRLLELYRVGGPREEYRLQMDVSSATTDADRSRAEKKLEEYRASLKSAEAEAAMLKAGHRERRKALGIPPEDWAD